MNLSLRNRVAASFIIANLVVLVLTFTVFHFLNSLNKDIEAITVQSNRVSLLTDEIRISAVSILKYQKRILANSHATPELVDKIINLCESFTSQLQTLGSIYKDPEIKNLVKTMLDNVEDLTNFLQKGSIYDRGRKSMEFMDNLTDKILEAFSEFQDIQYFQNVERDKKIKDIIKETKRNMMITLIIGFLGAIILALVVPGKIALPFKKIKDAIRELQDCNFDVSIYYSQNDEIGEIAREMNKMIHSFKIFEELRTDRINVENRKFDVLANMVKRPVLISNADGKLIYMNNQCYSLLQVQSEQVINKSIGETMLPESIIETFELAIKRRSKIENSEISIVSRNSGDEKDVADTIGHGEITDDQAKKEGEEGTENEGPKEKEVSYAYQGFASIIPIRGKESSLDYYLMVMSKEVFVS